MKHFNTLAYQESIDVLAELPAKSIISYQNTEGQHFQHSANDLIYHLLNYTTYHRGQIATKLKQLGLQASISDYIFYKR